MQLLKVLSPISETFGFIITEVNIVLFGKKDELIRVVELCELIVRVIFEQPKKEIEQTFKNDNTSTNNKIEANFTRRNRVKLVELFRPSGCDKEHYWKLRCDPSRLLRIHSGVRWSSVWVAI